MFIPMSILGGGACKTAMVAALAVGAASIVTGSQTTVASVACSDTVRLRISDPSPKQGSVLLVEVRSEAALRSVEGSSAGETLYFWHDDDFHVFQALFGIDFLTRPGPRSLRAQAASESGSPVECTTELRVVDGEFPVQRLTVEPKFVELSPENLARSRRETAELRSIFTSTTPERLWQRGFGAPVPGYAPSGSFGKRRVFNDQPRSPHSGEDFPAPAGTPVRAPARGRVALAKGLFFLGNTVVLDHGFGLVSFFGHLSSIDVEAGAMVDAETVLGKVGATGRVTGAHLHWGVRLGDARVNPMDLLELGR